MRSVPHHRTTSFSDSRTEGSVGEDQRAVSDSSPGQEQSWHSACSGVEYTYMHNGTSPARAEGRADHIERVSVAPPFLYVFPGRDCDALREHPAWSRMWSAHCQSERRRHPVSPTVFMFGWVALCAAVLF